MAAHSAGRPAIPPVEWDQPETGRQQWLRDIAQSVNLMSRWVGVAAAPGGAGDISSVTAGSGLLGGGTSGDVTLSLGTITVTGDASGSGSTSIPLSITGLQGRPVSGTAPTTNQVLAWTGSAWAPATVSGGSGSFLPLTGGTLSGQLTIATPSYPKLMWSSTSNAVDAKKWQSYVNPAGGFRIGGLNDAENAESGGINISRAGDVTLSGLYLYFANGTGTVNATGGPLIYGDSATMVFKVGNNVNGWFFQNASGTTVATVGAGGSIYAGPTGSGQARLEPGGASAAGYVGIHRPDGTRLGYLGYDTSRPQFTIEQGGQFWFQGGDLCIRNSGSADGVMARKDGHLLCYYPSNNAYNVDIWNDGGGGNINNNGCPLYINWYSQAETYFGNGITLYNNGWVAMLGGKARAYQSGNNNNYIEMFHDGNGHIESTVQLWLNYNGVPVNVGNQLNVNGQIWCNNSILCGNDCWYYGRTNGNNYYDILGCVGNLTYVGNATWDTRMRAASSVWTQCHIAPLSNNTYYCGHSGSLWYQVQAYSFYNPSDISLKHDIAEAPSCLDVVRAIKPKTFKYNNSLDDRTHWGFVAQDVAAAMHEAGYDFGGHVPVDEMHPQEGLVLNEMVAALWRAVQELAAKVEARDG